MANLRDVKFLEYSDLSRLLYTADRSHLIPDNAASAILNVLADDKGIRPREGSVRLGNEITASGSLNEGWNFKKRTGFEILVRRRDTAVEFYGSDEETWYSLALTVTTGKKMGFASYNDNAMDRLLFGNGVEPSTTSMYRWRGAICRADGAYAGGAGNITVKNPTGQTGDATADFPASGNIVTGGVSRAYSAKTATTITVGAGFPALTDGEYIALAVDTVSPGGNFANGTIFTVWNSRLVVSGIPGDESAFVYSKTGDPESFTQSTPRVPGDGGIEDFPEGGGPITSLHPFQDKLIVAKEDGVRLFDLLQQNVSTDEYPVLKPLVIGVDVGPVNHLGTALAENSLFYVTRIGGVKSLSRVVGQEETAFNLTDITEAIFPTVKNFDFTSAASVFFKKKVLISCKEVSTDSVNNIVIAYNIRTKGLSIFRGWSVASWLVYNRKLYFNSASDQNTYEALVEERYDDNGNAMSASYTSKEFTFGSDAKKKAFDLWMVTGLIKSSSTLNVRISYESEGYVGKIEKTIEGTGLYVFQGPGVPFGEQEFGQATFGAPLEEITGYNFFRVFITLPRKFSPYRATITFYSTGVGQAWVVTGHAPNPTLRHEVPKNLKL